MKINKFTYDGFVIYAPLKCGTRWLAKTGAISLEIIDITEIKNPEKISYFVYRDPLDSFRSGLVTECAVGKGDAQSKWDGRVETLDSILKTFEHYNPTLYKELHSVIDTFDTNTFRFLELRELSNFFVIKTDNVYEYKADGYSFNKRIVGGIAHEQLFEMFETHHTELSDRYMEYINEDREWLNTLLNKFNIKEDYTNVEELRDIIIERNKPIKYIETRNLI